MHHPLISWVSIVACMEAVKFSSTWTLSFSVHSLYWVVEGRVAKGAEVEREEEQLEIENLHLDLSVGCSGCCSREPFFCPPKNMVVQIEKTKL